MSIDEATVRRLKVRLSVERHAQIRSIREIAASAIAAAGQVRDTRLQELENPALADPDWIADLLIEITLGPLANAVTKRIVNRVTKRIMTSRLGKGLGFTAPDPKIVPINELFVDLDRATASVPELTAQGAKWLEIWREVAQGLAGVGTSRAMRAAKGNVNPSRPALTGEGVAALDSPASAVEEAVLRSTAMQENAIGVVFDSYELDLSDPAITPKQVASLETFLGSLAKVPPVDGSEAIRLRLFFETCIWCLAFPSIARFNPARLYPTPVYRPIVPQPTHSTATNRLLVKTSLADYWVRRLPHQHGDGLQTWAQFDYPRRIGPPAPGMLPEYNVPWLDKDGKPLEHPFFLPNGAYTAVANYFARMGTEMQDVGNRLRRSVPKIYSPNVRAL